VSRALRRCPKNVLTNCFFLKRNSLQTITHCCAHSLPFSIWLPRIRVTVSNGASALHLSQLNSNSIELKLKPTELNSTGRAVAKQRNPKSCTADPVCNIHLQLNSISPPKELNSTELTSTTCKTKKE